MAREIAILKRAKISKAQQYTLFAVFGTAVFLGVAVAMVIHFVQQISFNARVISEEDKSIVAYSDAIKNIGVCRRPAGDVYTDDELRRCNPDMIESSAVPNTLRSNILENMAANEALNSVPKESSSECVNPATKKNYTYAELETLYDDAETADELRTASRLIQSCSALRIIPDALPAYRNEEALLSSLNKIFLLSGWEPNSLSPTGESSTSTLGPNLNTFSVRLSVEANVSTTKKVLDNIEHSIREFDIRRATIEWSTNDTLILQAQASAYYMNKTTIAESNKTIKVGGR